MSNNMQETAVSQHYIDELGAGIEHIWDVAQSLGLRPFPTNFEIVPATVMYEIGSYGMPGRFSHWTHGKAYQMQKTMYDYGLSKIYELVINTNPCSAFLLESNSVLQNKLVAAHVLAHSDFFANNAHFARTSRHMDDSVALNAERIRHYEFEHGTEEVEKLLDAVLSIQEHIDPYVTLEDVQPAEKKPARHHDGAYDDLWKLDKRGAEAGASDESPVRSRHKPSQPVRDLLLFILVHSPRLQDWERDVISIVRQESLYFYPQMQTKIINEGWASFWHARIMRELDLSTDDYMEFAELHASILQPSRQRLNPYHLGFRMLEDIERRWDEEGEGKGREKLFEVREIESDVSLIRNYLTQELVEEVARRCGITPLQVDEVIGYYSMLHRKPLGKYHVQVCTNIACQAVGGEELYEHASRVLQLGNKQASSDGLISLEEVECMGACSWAPAIQINYDFHHFVTPERFDRLMQALRDGSYEKKAS